MRRAVTGAGRLVREEPKIFGAALGRLRHEADRLPRVHRLDERDLVLASLDRVRYRVQDAPPLIAVDAPPGRERTLRCLRGGVDVLGVAGRHLGEPAAVDGTRIDERLVAHPAPVRATCDEVGQRRLAETGQKALGALEISLK